ncbi:hypothetical protein [Streptomyces sp. NPDC046805]|uniref:hypothetical protein n=1 Tax=Streptomyces sp. NPDC046805 TaxID=3155134 RepID=UPI0033CFA347
MNSAPQVQTAEISDAELDNVSGGLNPQVGLTAGSTSLSSSDVMGQLDAVKGQVMGAAGAVGGTLSQFSNASVSASI